MSIATRLERGGYGGPLEALVEPPIHVPFRDRPGRTIGQRVGVRAPVLFNAAGRAIRAFGRMGGREPRTGVPIDTEFGTLDTYSGARLVRQQVFLSHDDALQAAGLGGLAYGASDAPGR